MEIKCELLKDQQASGKNAVVKKKKCFLGLTFKSPINLFCLTCHMNKIVCLLFCLFCFLLHQHVFLIIYILQKHCVHFVFIDNC